LDSGGICLNKKEKQKKQKKKNKKPNKQTKKKHPKKTNKKKQKKDFSVRLRLKLPFCVADISLNASVLQTQA